MGGQALHGTSQQRLLRPPYPKEKLQWSQSCRRHILSDSLFLLTLYNKIQCIFNLNAPECDRKTPLAGGTRCRIKYQTSEYDFRQVTNYL